MASSTASPGPLGGFSAPTRDWFTGAFEAPTPAQVGAWEFITAGRDGLVVAPTGSGKTLAAFLWALDRVAFGEPATERAHRCRVLYVSPLKALAVDVERNLRAPLAGIRQAATRLGLPEPDVTVGLRSGDTPADVRRRLVSTPPDVLITTPESLFLMLTSQARESLRGVQTVIVDEIHAVAGTKRGAHLALSLERLDALLPRAAQRIGLSATVRPPEQVAQFLCGTRPVTLVQPPADKRFDLQVVVPVTDMAALGEQTGQFAGSAAGDGARASIWPAVEERIVDLVNAHRSTIVFANSRRLAERLTGRLNEIAYERATGEQLEPDLSAAAVIAASGASAGAPAEIARAHHGSVSREQRAEIETALKTGRLPAVVATSSLELGIDMGAVDLVVQVESPPSVASGLQRVGRAGHQVGAVSSGVILPKYRGDLVQTAVVVARMTQGLIESFTVPRNPLDVLAQQLVAMTAMEDWDVAELLALVRRATPFAALPQSAFDAVLDMLTGRYPSEDFAELRPRLVWDRVAGRVSARPGAQRLAVTSGGTIPDRGLFGVFLVGEKASRVGELDEEMVYESRVGDVFTLGTSSWRIEDITHDRVLVSPAPGQPGRLPYWHGDSLGRPAELGAAIGAFVRETGALAADDPAGAIERCRDTGLDENAATNLVAYLSEQRAATGHLPDDRTVVVERFRDELGDWRLVVHTPFGAPVHAPWALAVGTRLREHYGMDVQAMHGDDGMVFRLPDTDAEPPGAEIIALDAAEVEQIVTAEIGGSALFASRFRECAARALLLPRRDPGRRSPLWQQRQRSAQLLEVARRFASFPIVLEAVRECLQDVYDLPALTALLRQIEARQIRIVDVETPTPSPFARSLLFGYVAAFMYEGDAPLAERRAAALSLDSSLLAELLGQAELRELLDAGVVVTAQQQLQRLAEDRRVRDGEGVADLVRRLGPLSVAEIAARSVGRDLDTALDRVAELTAARRVITVRIAGAQRVAAVEDAGRLRDALGVPLPVGIPEVFTEPVADPVAELVLRYARSNVPFTAAAVATRYGLGIAVVEGTLRRLEATGRVAIGDLLPPESVPGLRALALEGTGLPVGSGPDPVAAAGQGREWCEADVLRLLRRRSLAALRREIEPVPQPALGRFLPTWQHVRSPLHGADGLLRVVEQLAGVPVPASALETLVLPSRVANYHPGLLDELTAGGEVVWAGHGSLPGGDGWVSLHVADTAHLTLPEPDPVAELPELYRAVLDVLNGGGAYFFTQLAAAVAASRDSGGDGPERVSDSDLSAAIWELVWSGHLTNDTLAPLRALTGGPHGAGGRRGGGPRRAPRRVRYARPGPRMPVRTAPPIVGGRWALTGELDTDPTRRMHALAEALLDRHGVVTRGCVQAERVPGGFAAVYRVLAAFEEAGRCRRGYFVAGLGAAQFGATGAVDRLRAADDNPGSGGPGGPGPDGPGQMLAATDRPGSRRSEPVRAVVLAATDPANPFGAALEWPAREEPGGHRPGRKAGAVVVLVDGELALYVERGGRSLLSWSEQPARLGPAADALALAVRDGALGRLTVEKADGEHVLSSALGQVLEQAGFHATPRGLRLRA